ncbi:MAG: hypothetical protein GX259_00930 [Bacteroidales bacterium]|nr:hypothetical protein [Bacteroidales bacterium]
MKNINITLLLIITMLLSACKTATIYNDVLIPAQVTLPQHIQKIGVLNRSLPAKGEVWKNVVEGIFTGESIMADREGSYNVCKGLVFKVNNNPRFVARLLENEDIRGTGTKKFPAPISWEVISQLCMIYDVDAIVSLETFDSDISRKSSVKDVKKRIKDEDVVVPEYTENVDVRVNAGWRIYDPTNKTVSENVFTDSKGWKGVGATAQEALNKIPPKRNIINESGFFCGEMMGVRISPNWVRVPRYYYVSGDDNLKRAKYFVKVNNWKEAVAIWTKLARSSDPKIAGRACHNMAVAAETEGYLNVALDWANKAYKNYYLKKERNYINTLNKRLREEQLLREQLPSEK